MPADPPPAPSDDRRFLRCPTCGRAEHVTQSDLMGHARNGWPKCCGQVMDYITEDTAALCPTCGQPGGLTFPANGTAGRSVQIVCVLCALASNTETAS